MSTGFLVQHLAVLGRKEVRLLLGEKVVIGFAEQFFPRISHQLFAGLVESNEPEGLGILDEDHVGNVFHDVIEKFLVLAQIAMTQQAGQRVAQSPADRFEHLLLGCPDTGMGALMDSELPWNTCFRINGHRHDALKPESFRYMLGQRMRRPRTECYRTVLGEQDTKRLGKLRIHGHLSLRIPDPGISRLVAFHGHRPCLHAGSQGYIR